MGVDRGPEPDDEMLGWESVAIVVVVAAIVLVLRGLGLL